MYSAAAEQDSENEGDDAADLVAIRYVSMHI